MADPATGSVGPASVGRGPQMPPISPEGQEMFAEQARTQAKKALAAEERTRQEALQANEGLEAVNPLEGAELTDEEIDSVFSGIGLS